MLPSANCAAATKRRPPEINLNLDSSEAEQAIAIVEKERSGERVGDQDWSRLFGTAPYRALKEREASRGAGFTDDQFKAFLSSLSPKWMFGSAPSPG
jgi:hypothetical protein